MAAGQGFVAVVGARVLPEAVAPQVAAWCGAFCRAGWGIGSGGARGADAYALDAVVAAGPAACARSVVFLPGAVPAQDGGARRLRRRRAGAWCPASAAGRVALLARSRRLARASAGVVAFLWGPSRGSVFTVREAIRAGKPAAVVLAGGGAVPARVRRGPVGAVPARVGATRSGGIRSRGSPSRRVVARAGLPGAGGRADARAARAHRRLERGRAAVVRARRPRGRHRRWCRTRRCPTRRRSSPPGG